MNLPKIQIIKANLDYLRYITFIENISFPVSWRSTNFLKELTNNKAVYFIAYRKMDVDDNFRKYEKCILKNGIVIGFAGIWLYEDFSEIITVAVLKDFRKIGVGYLLISKLIYYATLNRVKKINLEVERNNIAGQNLYSKFGFQKNGLRKGYYSHNGEDAILMSLKIN